MVTRFILIAISSIVALNGFAEETINSDVVARIKEEAFQHSQAMETLIYISDVYGPRLGGSPAYLEAAEWTMKQLEEWGAENVHLDSYNDDLRGWEIESYSVEMISPRYMNITALPAAWTKGTDGEVVGEPIMVDYTSWRALQKLEGKLRGKILMSPEIRTHGTKREGRFTDEQLAIADGHINVQNDDGLDNADYPPSGGGGQRRNEGKSEIGNLEEYMLAQGVAATIQGSNKEPGNLNSVQKRYTKKGDIKPVPHFVISKEQHARMVRMVERGSKIELKLHLKTKFNTDSKYHQNIIAEIPGTDRKLKKQIVMVGGHFDSYHSGTGASDNAVGVATTMETIRILNTLGIKPRRTIRLVLWGGEELGLQGSRGYVKKYVADPKTGEDKGELDRISVYFNHDNNGHEIRGIYTLGNEPIRPIFESYLEPFHYLGAETVTAEYAGGTDHTVFDALNIPAFEWIQDPMQYHYTQIHTSMDVVDYIREDTLKRNAAIITTFVYHAAMRDEMMPRRKVPSK